MQNEKSSYLSVPHVEHSASNIEHGT